MGSSTENNTNPENQNNDMFSHKLKILHSDKVSDEQRRKNKEALDKLLADPETPIILAELDRKRKREQRKQKKAKLEAERLERDKQMLQRYEELLTSVSRNQRRRMRKNLKITEDNKLEVVPLGKKFSILTAKEDYEGIFPGSYEDFCENKGYPGVTYFQRNSAIQTADKQNKSFLKNIAEVEKLIIYIPGKNKHEKIMNFIRLFGLSKSGYLDPAPIHWQNVGEEGYVTLSTEDWNDVGEIYWSSVLSGIRVSNGKFFTPAIVWENV